MNDTSPLSVILVTNDSKGDRLLFKYPYVNEEISDQLPVDKRHSFYALPPKDDLQVGRASSSNVVDGGHLLGFPDKVLSTLFAVKPQLCGQKFEVKVNDVRFVSHPTSLQNSSCSSSSSSSSSAHAAFNVAAAASSASSCCLPKGQMTSIILFNVVFALHATASHSIVNCYHDLSKRLGVAMRHEERRCGYLTNEAKIMLAAHEDEVATHPPENKHRFLSTQLRSPFEVILTNSKLANELKKAYDSLVNTGIVHLFVNNWVELSFCLPQRVHNLHNKSLIVEPEALQKCFAALRPYHGVLLLVDEKELLSSLTSDSSTALSRLIRVVSPLKSLQRLALDADLPLQQVFDLVCHLVYWAKATIIYPLCETNVYVLSPNAPTHITSHLVEWFTERFPGVSLMAVMSEFSFPTSLNQNPLHLPHQQVQQVQMVAWMLQHHLLMQLHTYVYLMPTAQGSTLLTNNTGRNKWLRSLQLDNGSSGKVASDSDACSVTSDEYSPSPANIKSNGSLLSDDLFPEKHLHDCLQVDLTRVEKENIMKVSAATNPEDLRLFGRLCPYFRGRHHLEEIMYNENVRRSQLLALLDKFRNVLITCQHEDTAIAMFYRYNKS